MHRLNAERRKRELKWERQGEVNGKWERVREGGEDGEKKG